MTTYYLIRGDQILITIDAGAGDVISIPLLGGGDAMSLLNQTHAQNLMSNLSLTAAEALAALGLSDLSSGQLSAVVLASEAAILSVDITGLVPNHLIDVSPQYSLWQVVGQQDDMLALHADLWALAPIETLGLLAVVQTFGSAFYPAAVRTATGMTVEQALARRDKVATYLEGLGYDDTDDLCAATNEHDQMIGIVIALGYTEQQLWNAMVE